MTRSGEETVSPQLLLETKLFVPKVHGRLVPRRRLSERLEHGTAARLTLVSAPAGFGKTTLMAEWLGAQKRPVAWVSLDPGDNKLTTFWTYVVAALQRVAPAAGAGAEALLRSAPAPSITTVLTSLLNDLGAADHHVVLVLDDYHVIEAPEVQESMAFFLDHLPPGVHLVVTGRADPALPLARLRARGELVEVRAADLRFTADEAVDYLNGVMGLQLTAADVLTLEGRTEGWIAALQLAALSMRGREDPTAFIASFAGDDRYIVDYLVEEVLARQSHDVQQFLLQTSILDRLSGPLCDAVTAKDGGKATLEVLDRANLFLVPLDDRRQWYRYHHLFADVLRARLHDEQPERLTELHRRASDWYEEHGERTVAIDHALAGQDFARAADLIELAAPLTRRNRQEAMLRRWLESLPDEHLRVRPVLINGYVGSMMSTGEFQNVETHLQDAERWLAATWEGGGERPPEMVVVDEEGFRTLPTWVAVHRAGQALGLGDRVGTIAHARRALALAGEDDDLARAAAAALMGLASWGTGDLEAAHAGYAESMGSMQRAGHLADILGLAITMADIEIIQGRLGEAMRTYERALRLAPGGHGEVLRGTADMYVGMAAVHCERGDLAEAKRLLQSSQELGEHMGLPQNPHRWRLAMAGVARAEGDLDAAVTLLDDAERVYAGDFSPNVRPIPAVRARVWLAQGKLDHAAAWAQEQGLLAHDDLTYLREFEHVTLARLLLAQYGAGAAIRSGHQALELLARLLSAASAGGRAGTALEVQLLQALGYRLRGDTATALTTLETVLAQAEPEGYVRLFVDEGAPMADLLAVAAQRGVASGYVRRLRAAWDEPSTRASATRGSTGLVEPLSDRELDVLRLLASDLGGPDIARELVLSLNTVRTHTKNIYTKLGVNNRRAAVSRAKDLDLLRTRR